MEMSKFIKATVSIIIMVVVVVAVAIPIIGSMDNASGDNTGETARYSVGGSHYITYGTSGSTLDGEDLTPGSGSITVMFGNTFNVTMATGGAVTVNYVSGATYTTETLEDGGAVRISNGIATVTTNSSDDGTTVEYSKAYTYDPDGSWGMYSADTIEALEGTTVTAWVASSTQMGFADIMGGDLVSSTAYTISSTTATAQTITSITAGYTENEDGSVSYTAPVTLTYSGGTISATSLIAPIHYGNANSEAINSMIMLVPLLIVVGMIIAVIALFVSKGRTD